MTSRTSKIWSGVFKDFATAGGEVQNHLSDRWVSKSLQRLEAVQAGDCRTPMEIFSSNPHLVLGPMLDLLGSSSDTHVLDFGGNLGQLPIWTRQFANSTSVTWTVLERADFLQDKRVANQLPKGIVFTSSLEDVSGDIGLLHFGSSLQYVEAFRDEVGFFLQKCAPRWVTVADFMGGWDVPDFVTRQRYGEGFIVSRFRNLRTFVTELETYGYELISAVGSINEVNQHYYPEPGLPEGYRILVPYDLVFKKTG